jgi:uncharacterized protein (DUF1015 family)
LGLEIPDILLPRGADLRKWPVIACDQFTQDRGYWEKVKAAAAGMPSTFNLIFPEAFLPDGDAYKRAADINSAMDRYLKEGVFQEPHRGFVYVERDTPYQKKRRGLVAAVDLEHYDWEGDSRPLIRSTEGTVPERLPPRIYIRRCASLDVSHILLLIDDDADSLLPALGERVKNNEPVYQTELMMDAGGVCGWFVDAESDLAFIAEKLEDLCRRSVSRYADGSGAPFLFAAGDGNHSLAAAKGVWEECKKSFHEGGLPAHPCRYALVEIENIYDPAIQFEPIHRLVFDAGFDEAVSLLSRLAGFSCRHVESAEELSRLCRQPCAGNRFGVAACGRFALIETSEPGISTACLQPLLDGAREIDYIHDEEELFRLAEDAGRKTAGILLPPVQKAGLFQTVARSGPLPRKSFSMGHACEKRFYLECRRMN